MANAPRPEKPVRPAKPAKGAPRKPRSLYSSPIARLILAFNLAGLIILIAGALVLNEVRASLVNARKASLEEMGQLILLHDRQCDDRRSSRTRHRRSHSSADLHAADQGDAHHRA